MQFDGGAQHFRALDQPLRVDGHANGDLIAIGILSVHFSQNGTANAGARVEVVGQREVHVQMGVEVDGRLKS
jgi:hypothetical protein